MGGLFSDGRNESGKEGKIDDVGKVGENCLRGSE